MTTSLATSTPMDVETDFKNDMITELIQTYPTCSYAEIHMIVNKCYPDVDGILDLLEKKSVHPKISKKKDPSEKEERRRLKALEREEKKKIKAELKEARREQKLLKKEQKRQSKLEYKSLKKEFKQLPKAVIREASDHYANRDVLVNYLKALNGQIDKPVEVMAEETKLPSVPYDQDIAKGPKGPDNFTRFRAGLFDAKDKLKELKKDERRSKDPETLEKCRVMREQYEEVIEQEQMKAIMLTL